MTVLLNDKHKHIAIFSLCRTFLIYNYHKWFTLKYNHDEKNKGKQRTRTDKPVIYIRILKWNRIHKKIELVQWCGHESIFLHASTLPTLIHNLVWKDQNGENVCKFGRICVRYFFTIYVNGWITIIHSFTTDIVKDTTVNVK